MGSTDLEVRANGKFSNLHGAFSSAAYF